MKNEPVALMTEYGIKPLYEGALQEGMFLYTHPAKTLTEDEIREVADSVCHTWKKNGVGELYMEDFARAILRKAQENAPNNL